MTHAGKSPGTDAAADRVSRRILMLAACPFPSPQGSQVFVRQMCERLAVAGHDVHLLTYGRGEHVRAEYHHHRCWAPGRDAMRSGPSLDKPLLDASLLMSLIRLTRRHAIDVVHAHNYEAAIVALAARVVTGVPVLYHSHNMMGDELPTYFSSPAARRFAGWFGRQLDANVPRRADHAVALCRYTADQMITLGTSTDRLSVIPPAVDDDGALGDDGALTGEVASETAGSPRNGQPCGGRDRARKQLGLDSGAFYVGYSGNLDAYQNIPTLLEATARLVEAEPGARLLVATHETDENFVKGLHAAGVQRSVDVVHLSDHALGRAALAASDVLVLPRRLGSGFPIKLLNYLSAAKPVITAGCGGKVLADGTDALLVRDDDPEALAAAFVRTARDPALRAELARGARQAFVERLRWEVVLPQIEDVYSVLQRT